MNAIDKLLFTLESGCDAYLNEQKEASIAVLKIDNYLTDLGLKLRKKHTSEQFEKYKELCEAYAVIRKSINDYHIMGLQNSKLLKSVDSLLKQNKSLKNELELLKKQIDF